MKTWESGGIAPRFLTSALDGGEWSGSRPTALPPVPIGWAPEPVWALASRVQR
jgi:hypothetical protein